MAIFVAFIVLALAANWGFFLNYVAAVALLVFLHNGLALGAGYGAARLAGLSEYDRRAVTIETGIQNSGLGLILILGFFHGLGGMAVVAAFWGIWHAISVSPWRRSGRAPKPRDEPYSDHRSGRCGWTKPAERVGGVRA